MARIKAILILNLQVTLMIPGEELTVISTNAVFTSEMLFTTLWSKLEEAICSMRQLN
jgi:hypothetical protein